jgi:hypothetical protein
MPCRPEAAAGGRGSAELRERLRAAGSSAEEEPERERLLELLLAESMAEMRRDREREIGQLKAGSSCTAAHGHA